MKNKNIINVTQNAWNKLKDINKFEYLCISLCTPTNSHLDIIKLLMTIMIKIQIMEVL